MLIDRSNLQQRAFVVVANNSSNLSSSSDLNQSIKLKSSSSSSSSNAIDVAHLASTSSSSPTGARSSSPFAVTRFLTYDAPSSPLSAHFSKSSSLIASLPRFLDPKPSLAAATAAAARVSTLISESDLRIQLERHSVLQFGRKVSTRSRAKKSTAAGANETAIPIHLPRSAKHASRLHCTVRLLDSKGAEEHTATVQIKVLGQNGMRIQGKRYGKDRIVGLEVVSGMQVALDFWGWSTTVVVGAIDHLDAIKVEAIRSTREESIRNEETSSDIDIDDEDEGEDEDMDIAASSVPASPALSALSVLSSSPLREGPISTTRAAALARSLHLDLPGLIASAIVFHPRSTVTVEEIVRALLKEVGGMWSIVDGGKKGAEKQASGSNGAISQSEENEREEMAVEAWWDMIESVMRKEEMFGCIENAGLRDAAGNELPPAYYYRPESDTSASRVEALEPFAKRVRVARVAAGGTRYFWRRPAIKRRWQG